VIPALDEIHAIGADHIDNPMFLRNSARPNTIPEMLQKFRFTDTAEWLAHYCFHEIENFQGNFPIGTDPVNKVFPKLRMKYA
jgi:hypothetical protein